MSFTFNADSTFTSTVGKKTLKGTYSYNASTKQVDLKYLKLLNLHAKVNCSSSSLELLFNSDKLLKLMAFIGSKSSSTALKTVSSLVRKLRWNDARIPALKIAKENRLILFRTP